MIITMLSSALQPLNGHHNQDKVTKAEKLTFSIKQGNLQKKIFKLFVDKRGDIFISFPYFDCEHYYCGTGYLPTDNTPRTFDVVAEGNESRIPVKLSYHQDGQIHFKPSGKIASKLTQAYKMAEVKGAPFSKLTAQHIVTIDIEGLERFQNFNKMKDNELYRGFEVPLDAKRFQFLFHAGLSDADVKGKFQGRKIINIERPSQPNPLIIGLLFSTFKDSTAKDNPHPSILCIAGFPRKKEGHELQFVYLMAN